MKLTFFCPFYGCQCFKSVRDIIVSNGSLPLYGNRVL